MPHDERKWIIIGAGVAGISAAIGCAMAGKKVLLIEQSGYLGGRARSFTDTTTGEIIDNGQHVLMGCYTSLLFALDTLGTSHLLRRQSALNVQFIDSDGRRDTLDTSHLPGKAGIVIGILNLKHVSWLSKVRALELALRMQLGSAKAGNKTALEFRQHPSIGRRLNIRNLPVAVDLFKNPFDFGILAEQLDLFGINVLSMNQ